MNKQLEQQMKDLEEMTGVLKEISPNMIQIVEFKRDFIKNLIFLSSGFIGFAIPILDQTDIIQTDWLFVSALFLFFAVVLLGVFYTYFLIDKEHATLQLGLELLKDQFSQPLEPEGVIQQLVQTQSKMQKIHNKPALIFTKYGYQTIVFCFLLGLLSLIFSIL